MRRTRPGALLLKQWNLDRLVTHFYTPLYNNKCYGWDEKERNELPSSATRSCHQLHLADGKVDKNTFYVYNVRK